MTEDMEKKLNELLGLKKQIEEMSEEKKKEVTASAFEKYKKEARRARIRFWIGFGLGLANYLFFLGLAGCIYNNDILKFVFIGIGILSLSIPSVAKLGLLIRLSKLEILQEMKQTELRITELLQKNKL